MQSAIGRCQLRKLESWVARRRRNAWILGEALGTLETLRVPAPPPHVGHAYYKFYAFVRPERLRAGWDRDRIMSTIAEQGVPCFSGSCSEIYLEKAFIEADLQPAVPPPTARALGETSLMWLVHPTLSDAEVRRACTVSRAVLNAAAA
jgi:dTDP-4-amino-4,6-dideoxygalactose transaminase